MTDRARTVLIVDDDPAMRLSVRDALEGVSLRVTEADDGREALRVLYAERPDLVVLDVAMPGMDGWQVLERIREIADMPVLMLTQMDQGINRVRGLRAGADDYLGKPFFMPELVARAEALLRRTRADRSRPRALDAGWLVFDRAARRVTVGGRPVELTPLEFRLLGVLADAAGDAVSRDDIMAGVWGSPEGVDPAQVALLASRLRRKLGDAPEGGSPVETVRGFGYRLRVDQGAPA
ncbi:MAG: response regulator transcription factor [Thermoleophilia bacterium]|nr:response regulator transcription factor [Thermoleophilia bacterium]